MLADEFVVTDSAGNSLANRTLLPIRETLVGVKQADLRVGADYALATYEPHDAAPLAARVRVVSIDGYGKASIRVVDPGPPPPENAWRAQPVERDEQRQVNTRHIACRWEEWSERAASLGAEKQAQAARNRAGWDEIARRRADRVVVEVDRALAADYDEDENDFDPETDGKERAVLGEAYITARGLGRYAIAEELRPLLVDLPVPVLRDILAANPRRDPGAPGSVAAIFLRAARLLEVARIASMDWQHHVSGAIRPAGLLDEADVAFVHAVRDSVVASGGELLLPPVPSLPGWVDADGADVRAVGPVFGWLRVAVGDTSGGRLHSPGCSSVRPCPVLLADHLPWWRVLLESLERLCGRCGGPAVRDLVPMAGLVAAVDVWHERGRDRIERWQQGALQRLLARTAAARAQALEPDITLAARIVAALAESVSAEDGWAGYALAAGTEWNYPGREFEQLSPRQREAARVLARDRLTVLVDVLPASQRPRPLPQAVDLEALRQRYRYLKDLLEGTVPQLDRLLFTLPGRIERAPHGSSRRRCVSAVRSTTSRRQRSRPWRRRRENARYRPGRPVARASPPCRLEHASAVGRDHPVRRRLHQRPGRHRRNRRRHH